MWNNEVRAEHPLDEPSAHGQREEDLGIGKRHVQEKSDARVREAPAHQQRDAEQLIVVYPDHIPGTPVLGDGIGIPLTHALVRVPAINSQRKAIDAVVANRPEHSVRYTFVEDLDLLRGERHGNRAETIELRGDSHCLIRVDIR